MILHPFLTLWFEILIGIKFHFFKTPGSTKALLVPSGNIDGRTLAFFLGFRAFEDDDVSRHAAEFWRAATLV